MTNPNRSYEEQDQEKSAPPAGRQIFKLILASMLVGFLMFQIGITPGDIFGGFGRWIGSFFSDFGSTIATMSVWFAYGAAVVFPIWILIRILKSFR